LIAISLLLLFTVGVFAASANQAAPVAKLYSSKLFYTVGEKGTYVFSILNPATNTGKVHCQVVISVPNGLHLESQSTTERSTGQSIMNFDLEPGQLSTTNMNFTTDKYANYEIKGVTYYSFANDNNSTGSVEFGNNMSIQATPGFDALTTCFVGLLACVFLLSRLKR
jgi:hypothetical protein